MPYIIHELIDEYSGHYLHEVQTWDEVIAQVKNTSVPKNLLNKFLAGKIDCMTWKNGEIFVTSGKITGPLG